MNPRIQPLSDAQTPDKSAKILKAVESAVGRVPNLHRTLAHAPAALQAYTSMAGALGAGALDPKLRESIAVAVAAKNRCQYCASAHTAIGEGAGVSATELSLNLQGESEDAKTRVVLSFATELIDTRGAVTRETLDAVRASGVSEEEIVEIVTHVGLNAFTNLFNVLAETTIDFPLVELPE